MWQCFVFTERKELFLQSTPVEIRPGPVDLSVSPLPFASASDNTSVSKWVLVSVWESSESTLISVCMFGNIYYLSLSMWYLMTFFGTSKSAACTDMVYFCVFSIEVDVTGSSTIHSEARRRASHMSPDSSGAGPKLESLLLHFGRRPSLRSCERWGVREFYLSIYLPIMLYCVVWLLMVGFTGIFVYNFPHVTHLAVELTHGWR